MSITPQESIMSPGMSNFAEGSDSKPSIEAEKLTLTQARKLLGVSPNKMSKLISDGTLRHEQDPLDQRVKLVRRKDVENLKQLSRKS
jgi:hypothetical protein